VRDELLKDFKSGYSKEFLSLMLAGGLLGAILPYLEGLLKDSPETQQVDARFQEIYSVIDMLTISGLSFSETFYWTGFLIPFLEVDQGLPFQEIKPEVIEAFVNATLETLEFARGKRDEVILLWLTTGQLIRLLQAGHRIPARLKRRSCLPEAWLLAHLLTGAPPGLFEEIAAKACISPDLPESPPKKKRRRSRHSRSRKKVFPV
jgi:poly(A) polymerase